MIGVEGVARGVVEGGAAANGHQQVQRDTGVAVAVNRVRIAVNRVRITVNRAKIIVRIAVNRAEIEFEKFRLNGRKAIPTMHFSVCKFINFVPHFIAKLK